MRVLPILADLDFSAWTLGDWGKVIVAVGAIVFLIYCCQGPAGKKKSGGSTSGSAASQAPAQQSQEQPPQGPQ